MGQNRRDPKCHIMLAPNNVVYDDLLDFDVWAIHCLACNTNITPDGRYRLGMVQRHLHEHGLHVRGTASTEDGYTVEREMHRDGSWCHTVQVVYAMGFGRGQAVLIVTRTFGMGLTAWRRSEKAQDGRTRVYKYQPTRATENGAYRPAQRVLGHVRSGARHG